MNNMDWLDSLTPQQLHLADMIIHKAQKEGVDPKLALALAFRESRLMHGSFEKDKDDKLVFKPTQGKSGEIGVMQVMPDTAKFHGYKPEDLNDLEKNMEIGIKVLKSHMGKFNDPLLAAAAYNAGPNHPYFQDPNKNQLPDSTQQYLKDINQLGGFQTTAPVDPGAEPIPPSADIGGSDTESPDWKEQFKEQLPGIAGAGVGSAVSTTLAAGQKAKRGMDLFADFMRSRAGTPQTPITGVNVPMPGMPGAAPGAPGAAPLSGIPSGGPDAGRLARGQTGTMPYNYAKAAGLTDIEAGRALDMTKQAGGVHDLTTQRREAMQRIQQLFPGESYIENPRFGGLMTLDQGAGGGPRQSFVQQGPAPSGAPPGAVPPQGTLTPLPPRIPVSATPPAPSLLDDAIAKLSNIARGGLSVLSSAPVAGALGGYGAATSGIEAYERSQKGDVTGRNIASLGTLQALAAIPLPVTQGIGLAAGIASPLGLAVLDRMRKIQAEPAPAPATGAEMLEARQPAFRYARP